MTKRPTNYDSCSIRRRAERQFAADSGFALVEFLITLPMLVVCLAVIVQIHRAHEAVFHTLTSVHQALVSRALERNCARADDECQYSTDPRSDGFDGVSTIVVWRLRIPVLAIFAGPSIASAALPPFSAGAIECPQEPCRRVRIASGSYMTPQHGLRFALDVGRLEVDQSAGIAGAMAAGVFDGAVDLRTAFRSGGTMLPPDGGH